MTLLTKMRANLVRPRGRDRSGLDEPSKTKKNDHA